MPNSFDNQKELRFIVTLGTGTFNSAGSDQVTLEGFRATVDIDKAGGAQMSTMRANIYGVSQSTMNALTSLQWQPGTIKRNQIEVYAIDGAQETLVFAGNIGNAWANYEQMPDVYLEIQAFAGLINQLTPVPPTSFQGTTDTATAMSTLAQAMGYLFENNGVNVQLKSPYLPGSAMDQALSLAKAAGVDLYLDDNTLAITQSQTPRNMALGLIPEISSSTGLVGYPTFGADGRGPSIVFQTLFNPAIRFGGQVQVVTSIQPAITNALKALSAAQAANGLWIVNSLGHRLQSQTPGGAWFSRVSCGKQRVIASV